MNEQLAAFIRDLAPVLEKHKAGFFYTTDDNGIHVSLGDNFRTLANIGWPTNGKSKEIDHLLSLANVEIRHANTKTNTAPSKQ